MFKRLIFSLWLFIGNGVLIAQHVNYSNPRIYAVIVGISDYKDNNIPDLKYAEKDAIAFYDFLRSASSGSVPDENIALLTGTKATMMNILKEVVSKFSRSTKEDMIIFYFSGHGKAGYDESGYFLTYDSDPEFELGSAISMPDLNKRIEGFRAKMKISYVDACHAGLFTSSGKGMKEEENAIIAKSYLESLNRSGKGYVKFLSSYARQESIEDQKLERSVFTYFLLKGLTGEADLSQPGTNYYKDGIVSISELNIYLSSNIPKYTQYKQNPSVDGVFNGEFPLSILKPEISLNIKMTQAPGFVETEKKVEVENKPKLSEFLEAECEIKSIGTILFHNNSNNKLNIELNFITPTGKEMFIGYISVDKKNSKPVNGLTAGIYTYEVTAYDYSGKTVATSHNFIYDSGRINLIKCKVDEIIIR